MPTNDPTTGMPPMIGRRLSIPEWLSYVAGYSFGTVAPSRLVLHHTAVPTVEQWAGLRSMLASLEPSQQCLVVGHAIPMPMIVRTREYGRALRDDSIRRTRPDPRLGMEVLTGGRPRRSE